MDILLTSVFYSENGCPVPFYEDGTMSFFSYNMESTTVGKYGPIQPDNRIKITMCRDNSIMYLRLASDENGVYLYNSFGCLFASAMVHIQSRVIPSAGELQGAIIVPEPVIPAMIVVYSGGEGLLCKRHWIWTNDTEISRLRFYPGGSVVELRDLDNASVEVGSWRVVHVSRNGGCRAFYQPPGASQYMRRIATNESVQIILRGRSINMYIMVDPKDETLVYLQQERSWFRVMYDDTVRLLDRRGNPACYAERVR